MDLVKDKLKSFISKRLAATIGGLVGVDQVLEIQLTGWQAAAVLIALILSYAVQDWIKAWRRES